jgi:hypothetical protein
MIIAGEVLSLCWFSDIFAASKRNKHATDYEQVRAMYIVIWLLFCGAGSE